MKRRRSVAGLQASRAQSKSAPDGPSPLRVLENKLFAQRWDIKGLTSQRDAAYAEIAKLKKETDKLRTGLERATADAKLAHNERETMRRALDAQLELGWQANAIAQLGELCRSRQGLTYDLESNPALLVEIMLIVIGGIFDHAFYELQLNASVDPLAALCHYVERGESEGLKANLLFDPAWYARQTQDTAPFLTRLGHYIAVGVGQGLAPHPFIDPDHTRRAAGHSGKGRFDALHFHLTEGRYRDIAPHPLIDLAWYRAQRGEALGRSEPLADYLTVGIKKGLSLNPLFDPAWYASTCDELRTSGEEPFRHYLTCGQDNELAPNPLFDPAFYREHWEGRQAPETGAELVHYATCGRALGARTHPLFDGAHYRRAAGEAGIGDPLAHYLAEGANKVLFPHPLFDLQYVRSTAPAALRYHANPLISFLRSPDRLVTSPHPLFDPVHYLQQVPVARNWSEGPFLHFLRFGEENGANPHPLFDNRFYRAQLPRGEKADLLLIHFLERGSEAGLRPHPLFDSEFYLKTNLDVAEARMNPLIHFVLYGGVKGDLRQPHLLFDIRYYADTYGEDLPGGTNFLLDFLANWRARPNAHRLFDMSHYAAHEPDCAAGRNPLVDYATRGRGAKAAPHPLFDPAFYEKKVDIAPGWRRTLLEHYCNRQAPASFFPHPDFDGARISRELGTDTTGLTLLERYLERKGKRRNTGVRRGRAAGSR